MGESQNPECLFSSCFPSQPTCHGEWLECSLSRKMRLAASILLLAGGCLAGPYIYHHGHYGLGPVARTRGLESIGVTGAQVRLESSSGVSGTLYIEQWPNIIRQFGSHVRIHGRVVGLERGLHGFHVHVNGNTSENCLGDGGERDIAGRAIVIHAGSDDLGTGTGDAEEGSKKTGNAGGRVACGVIEVVGGADQA